MMWIYNDWLIEYWMELIEDQYNVQSRDVILGRDEITFMFGLHVVCLPTGALDTKGSILRRCRRIVQKLVYET